VANLSAPSIQEPLSPGRGRGNTIDSLPENNPTNNGSNNTQVKEPQNLLKKSGSGETEKGNKRIQQMILITFSTCLEKKYLQTTPETVL
jgi:hypothetical protein